MLHTELDRDSPAADPNDVRELIGGLFFLALLGLGLYINVVVS